MPHEDWYKSFFEGAFQDVWREIIPDEDTKKEVGFITDIMQLKPGDRVLDIPCGTGRLTMPLAEYGCKMTGVDITENFLDDCRMKARVKHLEIELKKCDMREIAWDGEFDAVLCMGGSFGYFDDNGNLDFLKAASRALKPNGRLLLFVHVAESLFPKFRPQDFVRVGDFVVLDERVYDIENSRVDSKWTIIKDNQPSSAIDSSMRIYTYRQLCRLLRSVGFGSCEAYGSMEKAEFKFGSPRLFLKVVKDLG